MWCRGTKLSVALNLSACALLLCAGATFAGHAGAAGAFDGAYKGSQSTLRSNGSGECSNLNHDNMLLVIQDNHFNRRWGVADIPVDVGADGSFKGSAVTGQGRRLRVISIQGRITGNHLEADIGTELCAAHLSMTRS